VKFSYYFASKCRLFVIKWTWQESQAYRSGDRGTQYTFSQAFGPVSSQAQVYDETTAPLVKGLIDGKNGLLFAYGITNSGT
jgi:hypothetical protein